MSSDDTALWQLLRHHATRPDAADRAIAALAPFANITAESGYPLVSASKVNVSLFASLMWDAFKLPVNRCCFLPAGVPLRDLPPRGTATRFDDLVWQVYGERCPPFIGQLPFENAFGRSYGHRIKDALDKTLATTGDLVDKLHPARPLLTALRVQTALITSGRDLGGLPALVAHLAHWIPLVTDPEKPGTWYVVVGG